MNLVDLLNEHPMLVNSSLVLIALACLFPVLKSAFGKLTQVFQTLPTTLRQVKSIPGTIETDDVRIAFDALMTLDRLFASRGMSCEERSQLINDGLKRIITYVKDVAPKNGEVK